MKNYVREGQKLPLFGVGPYIVYGMAAVTIAGIILCAYVLKIGIGSEAINEIAEHLFSKYRFVGKLVNANRKWQMKLFRSAMYRKYTP